MCGNILRGRLMHPLLCDQTRQGSDACKPATTRVTPKVSHLQAPIETNALRAVRFVISYHICHLQRHTIYAKLHLSQLGQEKKNKYAGVHFWSRGRGEAFLQGNGPLNDLKK